MFALFHLGPKLKCYTRSLTPSANCCTGLVLSWCLFCDDWWASTHFLSTGQMIQPEIFKFSINLKQWNTSLDDVHHFFLYVSRCNDAISFRQETLSHESQNWLQLSGVYRNQGFNKLGWNYRAWVNQPKLFLPTGCNALSVNMCLP